MFTNDLIGSLVFAALFVGGIFGLLLLMAWLEGPSSPEEERQPSGTALVDGVPVAVAEATADGVPARR